MAPLPAEISDADVIEVSPVCTFVPGANEIEIARQLFRTADASWHDEIGYCIGSFAAYSVAHHHLGSSGGIATWLLVRLMQGGLSDFAVHVGPNASREEARFFGYRVNESTDQIESAATSFYYPVSMDEVLAIIEKRPGRYAVTGVPCFQKALRLLRAANPIIDGRIKFQIGIVCGQMKSAHYLEYLAQMAGLPQGMRHSATFRRKVAGRPMDEYTFEGVAHQSSGGKVLSRLTNSAVGLNWGMGYFKPKACDFCDDVFAETADIAVMDAWLPRFVDDSHGWSLVVTRSRGMQEEMLKGAQSREVVLERLTPDVIAESQRGCLNHRRGALRYRLCRNGSHWQATLRVRPANGLPRG